jgi:hypothetical protein
MFYKSVGYGGHTNPLLLDNAGICCLFKDSQQVAHTLNCDISSYTTSLANISKWLLVTCFKSCAKHNRSQTLQLYPNLLFMKCFSKESVAFSYLGFVFLEETSVLLPATDVEAFVCAFI